MMTSRQGRCVNPRMHCSWNFIREGKHSCHPEYTLERMHALGIQAVQGKCAHVRGWEKEYVGL